jgi:catechol 2,3-dioxygenase-like lactoylglutathione lyase family enzyme
MKTKIKSQKNSLIRSFYITVLGLVLVTFSATQTYAQQQAHLLGIDHVGVNVPDLKQAVSFFQDVLGFTPVTNLGPVPLDAAWKEANHMQVGTGPVTIKMVRAGYGSNIELFEYTDSKGSTQQPGADDIGATHIAFYTSDIKSAITYLKSKDVKFLGEPFTMPSGDTKGETFVYFLTPWGSKLELVSYPNGKGYEKGNPKTLLWSPKNAAGKPAKK